MNHRQEGFTSATAREVADDLARAATSPLQLRDGKAPDWITLIPAGLFTLVDGRGPFQNLDPQTVVAATRQRAGKTELPGDYDHHMDPPAEAGVKGIASGWVKELKVEDGAVRARVEWTSAGRQHIEAKEYRYVSPRFAADAGGNVLFIVRFALTNKPAITDLPAIAAATSGVDSAAGPAPISAAAVLADPELREICRQCGITPERFAETRAEEIRQRREVYGR